MNEIAKINNSGDNDLKAVLFYCMELIGFDSKNISREQLTTMIDFLKRNFQHYKIEDIKLAFEHGVKGDLDVKLEHYQNFNTLYISNVLQAYKRYKQNEARKPKLLEPTKELDRPKLSLYDCAKFIEDEFNKNGEMPFLANWDEAYDHLVETGKINLTLDEKKLFADVVRAEIQAEIVAYKGLKKDIYRVLENVIKNRKSFATECRKRYLKIYYENK